MPAHDDAAATEATPPTTPSHGHGRFLPGAVLANRYRIVALAGRGGMGEVYRADDLKIGESVALKFLPAGFERDSEELERLIGEVRIARQVSHPNVCRVYDAGEFAGHHFITMEYVDGEDLAALLRRIGRLPQEKALHIARQIAAGVAAAHVQGIVHRDLKPANIMLDGRGQARVTDFGIAAAVEALRGSSSLSGTPGYMAPEQLARGEVTTRTDVYALGLLFYEMLTGKRPPQPPAAADPHRPSEELPRPSQVVAGLDPAVDAAIATSLESDPAKRFGSAAELLAALPGGDPLAAAVRAGETPSPEMVAAASEEGTLAPGKALGLLALAVVAIAATIFTGARITGTDGVPMNRPPDALRDRAREIAQLLGGESAPRSDAWWMGLDSEYLRAYGIRPRVPELAQAHPPALRFYYRQSPRPILPVGDVIVTRRDPPLRWSGEVFLSTDPQGHLLQFDRIAQQVEKPDSSRAISPPDWSALLALTGTDVARLRAVEPMWMPDVPCDSRTAWISADSSDAVRIEAAAWMGKPVWLRTIPPWARQDRLPSEAPKDNIGWILFVGIVVAVTLSLGILARHNLRQGRSDRRGALRVATAVFLIFSLYHVLHFRWVADANQVWRFLVRQPFFPAIVAWLMYVSVEPFVRRRWPHRLIAWARLLEGRAADPLVGRELLFGTFAGLAGFLVSSIPAAIAGRQDLPILRALSQFGPASHTWGAIADGIATGLLNGLGSFALLLVFRVLLRRDFAAWTALGIIWTVIFAAATPMAPLDWIAAAVTGLILVGAMRVGILAVVAAWTAYNLPYVCGPLTLDATRWYAWHTAALGLLLLAMATWGFRAVLGRRRLLSDAMLEG